MTELNNQFLLLEQQLMYYKKEDFISLLSEDFIEYGSSGGIMEKPFLLNELTDQGIEECLFTVTNFQAIPIAEQLVQTRFVTTNRTNGNSQNRSSLWRNENGTWRMFFHQGTPIK
ncbi:DUF4440 domain-containing protein [Solibacillus sp. NPDC093137]|uniref:nuclear transport factor 2 family protein n=1 Tax=Solibacillus sp. NPDC093137 TaxID=3390678 RepID=UPI003D0908FE